MEASTDATREPLGYISKVSASNVTLTLQQLLRDEAAKHGITPSRVGDYVTIESDEFTIFGQLKDIELPNGNGASAPIAFVELLSTIEKNSGRISPGVLLPPNVGAEVRPANPHLIQMVVENRRTTDEQKKRVRLDFATLADADATPLELSPEMLFGRHLAILGASGGGKSWSVARLIEECARHNAKVVLFDATGEYHRLDEGTHHVHLGSDPNAPEHSMEVALPYFHLLERDLFAMFQPEGESQAPKLRSAIRSLKLAKYARELAPNGLIIKADKPKDFYNSELQHYLAKVENPYNDFNIYNLSMQIRNECVNVQRSSTETNVWGGHNSRDYSNCVPLIARIDDMLQSPNLEPIFNPHGKGSLFSELHWFMKENTRRIMRISLQHLSFAHHAREIVANAIGRHLLEIARRGRFRKRPLLVVVDEAHQFLNMSFGNEHATYALDSFALIAKEGRKYALNICLATQRPRDIPEGVLSQMGTLIVHRLTNDKDRGVVERAVGEFDSSAALKVPTLVPGSAVLIGVDYPMPLYIRVQKPECEPDSCGPDYQQYW